MNIFRAAIFVVSAFILSACGSNSSASNAWKIKSHVDKMTDQKTTYAIDTAKSSITNNYGMKFTPQLILGCKAAGQQAEAYLNLGDVAVISGDIVNNVHPVKIRFDKNQAINWNLAASDNGKAYSFNNPAAFLKKASSAQKMLLQFNTALLSNQMLINFDISGVSDIISKLKCHA